MPTFPRRALPALTDLAVRLLDSRKTGTASEAFAHELLARVPELCLRHGLDGVLAQLPADFDDDRAVQATLAARLDAADLDGGGPRNARPGKVADCVLGALDLTLSDEEDRIELDAAIRDELAKAIGTGLDAELAPARLRDAIIADARARSAPEHEGAFGKIIAQLDDRGLRMLKQPKVPLDASQAIQRALTEARHTVIGRTASAAIDRARAVLERVSPAAAARIDAPISLALTPREVAIARVCDDRASKVPETVVATLADALAELAQLTWRTAEVAARTYSPRETFAVGDAIDHPKLGRGVVVAVAGQKIEVQFGDAKSTLVHART
ncbi:MAG TPA: hypothetical protein VLT45_30650 [Kofleriaceae bacterium]|nr:hypothetical protein [Kofleriaceae bacterium]